MTGLEPSKVRLEPYDPSWPRRFNEEAGLLAGLLGPLVASIEHIGSTSVPGLDAKPILDIAIQTDTPQNLPKIESALTASGYIYKGEFGLPGRHFFVRGDPVFVHLHVVAAGCVHWNLWLQFRDALRAEEALRRDYLALKRELARRFASDRAAYTAAKTDFITRVCGTILNRS